MSYACVTSVKSIPATASAELVRAIDIILKKLYHEILPDDTLTALKLVSHNVSASFDKRHVKTDRTYNADCSLLSIIFNICFRLKRSKGLTSSIFKADKDASRLNNRHPITVTAIIRRIYCRISNRRLNQHVRTHYVQKGFRPSFGLVENVVWLTEAMALSQKQNLPLYEFMFDVKKAFKSVMHKHVFTALERT